MVVEVPPDRRDRRGWAGQLGANGLSLRLPQGTLRGLAGEVVIPPWEEDDSKTLKPAKQLARTPFIVGFGVDWFKCTICTTHILYGKTVAESRTELDVIQGGVYQESNRNQ
jgi:hypothetical protein